MPKNGLLWMFIRFLTHLGLFVLAYWLKSEVSWVIANLCITVGFLVTDHWLDKRPLKPALKAASYRDVGIAGSLLIASVLLMFLSVITFFWGHVACGLTKYLIKRAKRWQRGEKKRRLGSEIVEILLGQIGYRTGLDTSLDQDNLKRYLNSKPAPEGAKRVKEYLQVSELVDESSAADDSAKPKRQAAS
ncbi:MAG: hypothetical protein WC641_03315 [Patescibacteria group bacterium]